MDIMYIERGERKRKMVDGLEEGVKLKQHNKSGGTNTLMNSKGCTSSYISCLTQERKAQRTRMGFI